MKTWAIVTLLILTASSIARAQTAGQIVGIKGVTYIRAAPTAPRETLTLKHDKGRGVSFDDEISCNRGGLVELRLTGGIAYTIMGPSPWTPLPHVSSAVVSGMDEYYRRGGRERGEHPAIFSPIPDGVVPSETLTFRWKQLPGVETFTLMVFSPSRRLVWQQSGIDAAEGVLVSQSARQALRHVSPGERKGMFILVLQDQFNRLQVTRFRLAP